MYKCIKLIRTITDIQKSIANQNVNCYVHMYQNIKIKILKVTSYRTIL